MNHSAGRNRRQLTRCEGRGGERKRTGRIVLVPLDGVAEVGRELVVLRWGEDVRIRDRWGEPKARTKLW